MSHQSRPEYVPVTVDTRALIDKVLARYSSKFTVFRELLQNSEDAGCHSAEIHFETSSFLRSGVRPSALPDIGTAEVAQWTFKNQGKLFTEEDWDRLTRIASGNPSPDKVGMFGVGFYSLFSVTENPYVSSGDKEMKFSWDDGQLCYRSDNCPKVKDGDTLTTFKIPLREVAPMPPFSELMQFLASSITFMIYLKAVDVFFDGHCVGRIRKVAGGSQAVPIGPELTQLSPERNMTVKSVQQHSLTISAEVMPLPYDSMQMHEEKVNLTVFTAKLGIALDPKLSKELKRCTKKDSPPNLEYSLIYTKKDEYDRSPVDEQKYPHGFLSPLRGLRADLNGATHTRVFIGHATAQTTGIGGHMACRFIPTVERESIDLVDRNVAIWNKELLYVGGFLCRVVYDFELSRIQSAWSKAATNEPHSRPSRDVQHQLDKDFLHVLKFFTFHQSTPSPEVAELLGEAFYECSTLPLKLLTSVGIREASNVRLFDPVIIQFIKDLPMLSNHVTQDGARWITALPDRHKVPMITISDVLEDLHRHTLDVRELVTCLRWWTTSKRDDSTISPATLLKATTLRTAGGDTSLSTITHFIDPRFLGRHIPRNGPLPVTLLPLDISENFEYKELIGFGWQEFTVISWLQYISQPNVVSTNKMYDFTQSVEWAVCVLSTIPHVWPQLSRDMQDGSRKVFKDKPCIPTSKGLRCPQDSYLPIADNALFENFDLPIVNLDLISVADENMKRFLLNIGVRVSLPVHLILDQTMTTGDWSVSDLVDYLIQAGPSLTHEDMKALQSSTIFTREVFQNEEGSKRATRYSAKQLFPPLDIFRTLRLPVIEWGGTLNWKDTSSEARLLYDLGLNRFPPLQCIMKLCSSKDVGIQVAAFDYLCKNLHSQYSDYKSENFREVEFIPVECKGHTDLKRWGEVYSSTQWKTLGFYVVQDRFLSAPLHQLGVVPHPSTSAILELLEKTSPPNEETAKQWFEILFDHLATFSRPDLIKLSELPMIPTGQLSALKFLPPSKCYLYQETKPALYEKLFVFVNFGHKANHFLINCGLKNKVSIEDVAKALIKDPDNFLELAGGYEGFLVELRKFAYQSQEISNLTLNRMSRKPALLGVRRKRTDDGTGWDYEHKFLMYEELTIVDDVDDYQLFSDTLFIAPEEEAIKRFYASLGCSYLSAVVKETCSSLQESESSDACTDLQKRILERLPLFMQKCTDSKPKFTIPSEPEHLQVKACQRIRVSKTLITPSAQVTKPREVWAIARREGNRIEVWISRSTKRDMYDIATSLCRLLFGTNKMNTALLLETILSADKDILERRGFLVDQISDTRKDVRNEGKKKKSPEKPQTASSSSPSHPADSTLLKASNASNDDKSSDANGDRSHATSRTPREVIPQANIRSNAEKAIKACGSEGKKLAVATEESKPLSSGFCELRENIGNLDFVGKMKGIKVYVDKGVPESNRNTFMADEKGPITRFAEVIVALAGVYAPIPKTTLRIFYDVSGGCIAFNCNRNIYLNLRYFMTWHDKEVKDGELQNAQTSWYLTLAHEIAHNVTDQHDSEHEFWFAAVCEARLCAFSRLLHSAGARSPIANPLITYPVFSLRAKWWLANRAIVTIIVALIAFLVRRLLW